MEWLVECLADLYRPWHDDGLPESLAFGEIEGWGFVRGAMLRVARMTVSMSTPFGVFAILGERHARRAARAWWPPERLMMEDVSCAFGPI